jgi:hypothetical protein
MNTDKVIEILEALVINTKTNCDDAKTEKSLIIEAANDIIKLNFIELPFDEGRQKYYSMLLKEG